MHIIIICSDLRVWPRSWRQHQHLPATWPGILLLFLLLLLLLLLLSLNQKVDSNIRYNGNGYLPCNGFVPCQVIRLFAPLSSVSLSKDVKPKFRSQSPVITNSQAPGNSLMEGFGPKSNRPPTKVFWILFQVDLGLKSSHFVSACPVVAQAAWGADGGCGALSQLQGSRSQARGVLVIGQNRLRDLNTVWS